MYVNKNILHKPVRSMDQGVIVMKGYSTPPWNFRTGISQADVVYCHPKTPFLQGIYSEFTHPYLKIFTYLNKYYWVLGSF